MADARQVRELALLRRLMPPPAPSSGWGAARQQMEAQALGVLADEQAKSAEAQLVLSAVQTLDGQWTDNEFTWNFDVANCSGAAGKWLDAWGVILGTPRLVNEADALYARRILIEVSRAHHTNAGLAQAIDMLVQGTGTQVIDAADVMAEAVRFNTRYRFNNDRRYNSRGRFLDASCCYIVRLQGTPEHYSIKDIQKIVEDRQAAGTRLVLVQMAADLVPLYGPATAVFGETAVVTLDATDPYDIVWNVVNGVVVSGQGTTSATVTADVRGNMQVSVSAKINSEGEVPIFGVHYIRWD